MSSAAPVASAAPLVATTPAPPVTPAQTSRSDAATELLQGNIDGVVTDASGNSYITGWACAVGNTAPVTLNLYAHDPYPKGVSLSGVYANQTTTSAAIIAQCGDANHYFKFPLSHEVIFKHGQQPFYLYAPSPTRQRDLLIQGSGSTFLPAYNPVSANPKTCTVLNGDPNGCLASIAKFDILSFGSDYTCTSAATCCPNGAALIGINNLSNKAILGNGYTLHRMAGQTQCQAIQIQKSSEILVDNLNLDENAAIVPCELSDTPCAQTVLAAFDKNVKLNKVNLYYGKGYVVYVWGTDGFSFANSAISEAGQIGLYVGWYKASTQSSNIAITDSVFARTRTNAIAIQGAYSDNPNDPILIANNILTKNHWHGLWPAGHTGGITGGGQLYIADGSNISVINNIVADGYCENCYNGGPIITGQPLPVGEPVPAVEVGDVAPLSDVNISYNYIYNQGPDNLGAIRYDSVASVPVTNIQITNNRVLGGPDPNYKWIFTLTNFTTQNGNVITDNTLGDTVPSLAQDGQADYQVLRERGTMHWEAKLPGELPGSVIEGIFALSPSPRVGALARPLFRCSSNADPTDDYISQDQNCEGVGTLHSAVGYSYENNYSHYCPE